MIWLFRDKKLDRADKLQLVITYIMQLIIFGAIVWSLVQQNWFNGFLTFAILMLTFLPALIHRNYKVFLPVGFHFATVFFVFTALFLGEIHSYYAWLWWWDVMLHTLSGIMLGLVGFILVYVLNREKHVSIKMKPGFLSLFAFAFALAIGGVWEIFEFSMDQLFGFSMQKSGLVDTMWDLIVDMVGALFISFIGYFYIRKEDSLFFTRVIQRFVQKNPQMFRKRRNDHVSE
jgi:hypothetical protein